MSSTFTNEKEIRFAGMQRSGNHAVIKWILKQMPGRICFLNNVVPFISPNPFRTFLPNILMEYSGGFNFEDELNGKFSRKSCLLHSYEDQLLTDVFSGGFERNHDTLVGSSGKRYDILLLRDPFNMFASRLKKTRSETGYFEHAISMDCERNRDILVKLWKSYAREFLGHTSNLLHNKVLINFNKWLTDKEYRRSISKRLDLDFNDKGFNRRATGTAFDGVKNERVAPSDLFTRWQEFSDDPFFLSIFRDSEIVSLSNEIFGSL